MPYLTRIVTLAAALTAALPHALAAAPDVAAGKAYFESVCGMCHSAQRSGGPNEGPNMLGLVGRKAGSQPDFTKYSEALKASPLVWSVKTLDQFLINPGAKVPGTIMPLQIADNKIRANVIAYLATLKRPD